MPIPCYVSGKGMSATERTTQFKTAVIEFLESSGLGYDTRYRYYRRQLPEIDPHQLVRMVCDPIESYDQDWEGYHTAQPAGRDADEVITAFVMERDALFRREARVAIYCYDEAGFGSGVNSMRFILEGKRILGFYDPEVQHRDINLHNVLQLRFEFPTLVTVVPYRSLDEVRGQLLAWLPTR